MVVRSTTREPVNFVEVADPEVSYLPLQYSPTVAIVTGFPYLGGEDVNRVLHCRADEG